MPQLTTDSPELDQAQDVSTPVEQLLELLHSDMPGVAETAARNPNTPIEALTVTQALDHRADELAWLRGKLSHGQEQALMAGDRDLPVSEAVELATTEPVLDEELTDGAELTINEDVFAALTTDSDETVRQAAKENPAHSRTPTRSEYDLVTRSEGDGTPDLKEQPVVKSTRTYSPLDYKLIDVRNCTDPLMLKWYARHDDPLVREAVASNPGRRVDSSVLERLATDKEPSVRAAVARSCWTSPTLLARLAQDQDAYIRLAVSEHHALDANTAEALSKDASHVVRRTAQHRLGTEPKRNETPAVALSIQRRDSARESSPEQDETWARAMLKRVGLTEPTDQVVQDKVRQVQQLRRTPVAAQDRTQDRVLELTPYN